MYCNGRIESYVYTTSTILNQATRLIRHLTDQQYRLHTTGRTDILFLFFFSSRRRHTRFDCDWSSDVCSSDLRTDEERVVLLLLGPRPRVGPPTDEPEAGADLRNVVGRRREDLDEVLGRRGSKIVELAHAVHEVHGDRGRVFRVAPRDVIWLPRALALVLRAAEAVLERRADRVHVRHAHVRVADVHHRQPHRAAQDGVARRRRSGAERAHPRVQAGHPPFRPVDEHEGRVGAGRHGLVADVHLRLRQAADRRDQERQVLGTAAPGSTARPASVEMPGGLWVGTASARRRGEGPASPRRGSSGLAAATNVWGGRRRVGTPRRSSSTMSWAPHDVHDPQSAVVPTTASTSAAMRSASSAVQWRMSQPTEPV